MEDNILNELRALYYFIYKINPKNLIRKSVKDRIRFLQFALVNMKEPYIKLVKGSSIECTYHLTGQSFVSITQAAKTLGINPKELIEDIYSRKFKYAVYPNADQAHSYRRARKCQRTTIH